MVKHFLLLGLLSLSLYSKELNTIVKDIIGTHEYNLKKNFINILLKKNDYFLENGNYDYEKILQKLEDEGLLKLKKNSSPLRVAFTTKNKNLQLFMKVIKDSISSLGFNNPYTVKALKRGTKFVWIVSLGNNYMLNPLLLTKKLKEKNVFVTDMKRYSATNWNYTIDISGAVLIQNNLNYNEVVKLPKSINAQWINVKDCDKVEIQSSLANSWHPYVIIYNNDLKIISSIKSNKTKNKLTLNIPSDAVYLKLDDLYTMKNIKDSLSIFLEKRE